MGQEGVTPPRRTTVNDRSSAPLFGKAAFIFSPLPRIQHLWLLGTTALLTHAATSENLVGLEPTMLCPGLKARSIRRYSNRFILFYAPFNPFCPAPGTFSVHMFDFGARFLEPTHPIAPLVISFRSALHDSSVGTCIDKEIIQVVAAFIAFGLARIALMRWKLLNQVQQFIKLGLKCDAILAWLLIIRHSDKNLKDVLFATKLIQFRWVSSPL